MLRMVSDWTFLPDEAIVMQSMRRQLGASEEFLENAYCMR